MPGDHPVHWDHSIQGSTLSSIGVILNVSKGVSCAPQRAGSNSINNYDPRIHEPSTDQNIFGRHLCHRCPAYKIRYDLFAWPPLHVTQYNSTIAFKTPWPQKNYRHRHSASSAMRWVLGETRSRRYGTPARISSCAMDCLRSMKISGCSIRMRCQGIPVRRPHSYVWALAQPFAAYRHLYPPVFTCQEPTCRHFHNSAVKITLTEPCTYKATLFTLRDGALPVYTTSLYCRGTPPIKVSFLASYVACRLQSPLPPQLCGAFTNLLSDILWRDAKCGPGIPALLCRSCFTRVLHKWNGFWMVCTEEYYAVCHSPIGLS